MTLPIPSGAIPSGQEVLERERLSRRQGSQLTTADVVGRWRLHQLWSKTQAQPNPTAAGLLRSLNASLTIGAGTTAEGTLTKNALTVRNSVELGALRLCFRGHGQLRGTRPLLEFWFTELELRFGRQTLWRQAITRLPEPRRRPFFALIARTGNADSGWLLARGRGGGLALWILDPEP